MFMVTSNDDSLVNAINSIEKDGTNFVSVGGVAKSKLPSLPGLVVCGELISLPVLDVNLFERLGAKPSPHGQGLNTVLDPKIRSSLELPPEVVEFRNPDWNASLTDKVKEIGKDLVGNRRNVHATPYKMLFYRPGDHFVIHRDTEKEPGMFGTLVIQLPSIYKGGALNVKHGNDLFRYDFWENAPHYTHYTAHFADLEHWIEPITEGCRLVMVYNLVWTTDHNDPEISVLSLFESSLTKVKEAMKETSNELVAIGLNHEYTEDGLKGFTCLKGEDYRKAAIMKRAIENINSSGSLYLVLCEISQNVYGDGDNNSYGNITSSMIWLTFDDGNKMNNWGRVKLDFENDVDEDDDYNNKLRELEYGEENKKYVEFWKFKTTEGSLGYTGNEGSDETTTYKRAILVFAKFADKASFIQKSFGDLAFLDFKLSENSSEDVSSIIESGFKTWSLKEAFAALEVFIRNKRSDLVMLGMTKIAPKESAGFWKSELFSLTKYVNDNREGLLPVWKETISKFKVTSSVLVEWMDKIPKDMIWVLFNSCSYFESDDAIEIMQKMELEWLPYLDNLSDYGLSKIFNVMKPMEYFRTIRIKVLETLYVKNARCLDFDKLEDVDNAPVELVEKISTMYANDDDSISDFLTKPQEKLPFLREVIVPTMYRIMKERQAKEQGDEEEEALKSSDTKVTQVKRQKMLNLKELITKFEEEYNPSKN